MDETKELHGTHLGCHSVLAIKHLAIGQFWNTLTNSCEVSLFDGEQTTVAGPCPKILYRN